MATKRVPKKLDADDLWNYGLRVLGMRAHSFNELRQKLLRRAASPEAAGEAMNKLREYGFTDDQKYSEAVAAARLANQSFGRNRVLSELRAKRVPEKIAEAAVNKAYSGVEEPDLVRKFLARKYRGKDLRTLLAEQKQLAGAYRRLRVAGFSSNASLSVLKQYSKDVDDLNLPEDDSDQNLT